MKCITEISNGLSFRNMCWVGPKIKYTEFLLRIVDVHSNALLATEVLGFAGHDLKCAVQSR
jgi:hypothetical protein